MKAVVAAFNQEKALVGAFCVIMNLRMDLFEALVYILDKYWFDCGIVPPNGLSEPRWENINDKRILCTSNCGMPQYVNKCTQS